MYKTERICVCSFPDFRATNLLGLPKYTVVYYRVVSTKLTEEEHGRLLDVCNVAGCPPSALVREAIMKIINSEQKPAQKVDPMRTSARELSVKSQQIKKESFYDELDKLLGTKEVI